MTGRATPDRVQIVPISLGEAMTEARIYRCADCRRVITVYVPGYGWIGTGSHMRCPMRGATRS